MNFQNSRCIIWTLFFLFLKNSISAQSIKLVNESEYQKVYTGYLNKNNYLIEPVLQNFAIATGQYSRNVWKGSITGNVSLINHSMIVKTPSTGENFYKSENKAKVIELYINQNIGNWTFAAGRKKVRFGVGYVASPTDIIAQRNIYDDSDDRLYRILGNDLVQVSYTGINWAYDFYLLPNTNQNTQDYIKSNSIAMRFYKNFESVDLNLVGRLSDNRRYQLGLNATHAIGEKLEIHADALLQRSSDVLYPDDTQNNFGANKKPIARALIGGQYSPQSKWNIVLEYSYLSEGYSSDEWKSFDLITKKILSLIDTAPQGQESFKKIANSVSFPMRKNYLFLRITKKEILHKLNAESISFAGINEPGLLQRFALRYLLSNSTEFYAHYQCILKTENSAFNVINYNSKFRLGFMYGFSLNKKVVKN